MPSATPSFSPTSTPSASPSTFPSYEPTLSPSDFPSVSAFPTSSPSVAPSESVSVSPTLSPQPSSSPSQSPSQRCDRDFFNTPWTETGSNRRIDVDSDGSYSSGDILVYDSNIIKRENGPSGLVAGWCKILWDATKKYCVSTFEFPDGYVLTQGVYEATTISAGTDCHESLAGSIVASETADVLSYTFEQLGFLSNSACKDITNDFWTVTGFQQSIDNDSDGSLSPGDVYLLDEPILRGTRAEAIGTLTGECTILQDASFDNRYCFLTAYFQGGFVSFQGPFHSMLVTGGTGCFADSSGMIVGVPDVTSAQGEMTYKFMLSNEPGHASCKVNRFRDVWIETGLDVFLDRDGNARLSPGDTYLFNHVVATSGTGRNGTASGSCMYLETLPLETYCSINFDFAEGSLSVQGFFDDLVIGKFLFKLDVYDHVPQIFYLLSFFFSISVGSSGCFAGANGVVKSRAKPGQFEYSFEKTSLMANSDLDDGMDNTHTADCLKRDVSDLEGRWIEDNAQMLVDADSDSRESAGDLLVAERLIARNTDNPFTSGQHTSKCTALDGRGRYYCVSTIELDHGRVLYQGPLDDMVLSGGSECFADVQGTVSGAIYEDFITYDLTTSSEDNVDTCLPESDFLLAWEQSGSFYSVRYGAMGTTSPGDKLIVNDIFSTASGAMGQLVGECTFLPGVQRDSFFCSISFELPGGNINAMGQYESMVITGGSGCYSGLAGIISGTTTRDGAAYQVQLEDVDDVEASVCSVASTRFANNLIESGSDVYIDADKSGRVSPGDAFLFDLHPIESTNNDSSALANGNAAGVCTILGKSNHSFCTITFTFEEGTIATAGYFEDMVIIGGTGCYSGMKGMFYGADLSNGLFSYKVVQY